MDPLHPGSQLYRLAYSRLSVLRHRRAFRISLCSRRESAVLSFDSGRPFDRSSGGRTTGGTGLIIDPKTAQMRRFFFLFSNPRIIFAFPIEIRKIYAIMSPTEEALGILKKTDGGGYSGESRRKCGCRRCKAQAESLRQKNGADKSNNIFIVCMSFLRSHRYNFIGSFLFYFWRKTKWTRY